MTKAELVAHVAGKTGLTKKDSARAVQAIFDGIRDSLRRGQKVSLVGFGTFSVRSRKARKGRNPRTRMAINIAARKVPVFKAGKGLRTAVGR